MRLRSELLAGLIALIAIPSLAVIIHFKSMPVQPIHPAIARVVAIAPWAAKFRADRDTIVLRNARATGQFSMHNGEVRCHVGDRVPVQQQGVVLTPVPKTCR
jgi:hypothetical protein